MGCAKTLPLARSRVGFNSIKTCADSRANQTTRVSYRGHCEFAVVRNCAMCWDSFRVCIWDAGSSRRYHARATTGYYGSTGFRVQMQDLSMVHHAPLTVKGLHLVGQQNKVVQLDRRGYPKLGHRSAPAYVLSSENPFVKEACSDPIDAGARAAGTE
jgi:hypothetical protein